MNKLSLAALTVLLIGCDPDPGKDDTGLVDADGDGFTDDVDCDDNDPTVYPGADEVCDGKDNNCDGQVDVGAIDMTTWYLDADGDGYGDPDESVEACDAPSGYVADGTDCDDDDPTVNPGATEVCDGKDNNCDGQVDEGVMTTWYLDADGDGYGDPDESADSCEAPSGYVADGTDCDDSDDSINPGADEVCDGVDNNCDGQVDVGAIDALTWYLDADSDGYGDPDEPVVSCEAPSGYVADNTDCDDSDAAINSAAAEVCDGVDNNCDGQVDVGAIDALTWYLDADSDGYGDPDEPVEACTAPTGFVADNTDCDDSDDTVYPGADEVCDGVDNNCDGDIDVGAIDADTWYADSDGDGYGDATVSVDACEPPTGYVADDTDCDDTDDTVYPGADEIAGDGIDQDCDGVDLQMVGYAHTQWPCSDSLYEGDTVDSYGWVYMSGVTDSAGEGPGITGQAGYGPEGSDPELDADYWTWVDGAYFGDTDGLGILDNDEYLAVLTPATGDWDYGWRFSTDGGTTWVYGDLGPDCGGAGSDDGWVLPGSLEVISTASYVLAGFDFDGTSPTAPSTTGSGVTVSDISSAGGSFSFYSGSPGSAASLNGWDGALGDNYFEFTITPDSTEVELDEFTFDDRASGTGPTAWQLLIYADTGTWEVVGSGATSTAFSSNPMNTVDLTSFGPYTSSFTFRLTASGASSSTGTWRIDNVEVDGYAW